LANFFDRSTPLSACTLLALATEAALLALVLAHRVLDRPIQDCLVYASTFKEILATRFLVVSSRIASFVGFSIRQHLRLQTHTSRRKLYYIWGTCR